MNRNTATRTSHTWRRNSLIAILTTSGLILAGATAASAAGFTALSPAQSSVQSAVQTAVPSNSVGLFGTETPAVSNASDTASVELGTSFTPSVAGQATGIRFYKGSSNTGTHTGSIWTSGGTRLATVTFTGETASGWQGATLSTPVNLTAGTRYVVSYKAPQGRYSYTTNYFANAKTTGSLTAGATSNGRYLYGSGGFPTSSYNATNYFVDVAFTATPTSTPTPTPTPAPTGWPSASTTGVPAGTTLTNSGGITITTAGAVLSGLNITGNVTVQAPNVTIKNSKITGKIEVYSSGATFQRVEIVGPGTSGAYDNAIGWANYTCDGCNVHGWGKAFYMEDNVTIKNSWVHDLSVIGDPANGGSHNEAVYTQGGSNFIILNNRLDSGNAPNFSASVAMYGKQRALTNALVQGNLMNGGGYCLYAGYEFGIPPVNARYIGNTFGNSAYPNCGQFGAATGYYAGNGNEWTGNVWANGSSVPAPK